MIRFLSSIAVFSILVVTAEGTDERRPNVIFLLADDLGYGDLGCFGQKIIRTPHLDRMAAEGMRLTQHYSGNAVCAPSRCVLMTGKHPGHAYIRNNREFKPEGQEPLPAGTLTLPKLLQAANYATGGYGKWGLGGSTTDGRPLTQGFDHFFGYHCQAVAHNFYPTHLWDDEKKVELKNPAFSAHDKFKPAEDPTNPASYRRFEGTEYSADLIARKALEFVRDHRKEPFFCYYPTTVPHVALQVPEDSLAEYRGKFDDAPYAGGRGYLPHYSPRAAYAAMITRMDREIGRLLDLLKELGIDEQTIVVFSSDNGPLHGEHQGLAGTDALFFNSSGGLRNGKGTLYEGGIRVPCIVRWPGKVKAGSVSDRVSGFEDWLPTFLELAGLAEKVPDGTDGVSLVPTLLGKGQPERPYLYREFPGYGGQRSVRAGDWKLVQRNLMPTRKTAKQPATLELFNLKADPGESQDMANEKPEIVSRLSAIMASQHLPSTVFPFPAIDSPGK